MHYFQIKISSLVFLTTGLKALKHKSAQRPTTPKTPNTKHPLEPNRNTIKQITAPQYNKPN